MSAEMRALPSPFDVPVPAGAEGWEAMYPGHMLFSEDCREWEERCFWFQDGMHHPEVLYPFDSVIAECWRLGLGQYNSRIFAVPPAYGLDHRVLNGFLYVTPVAVQDAARVEERAVIFEERASHYYRNWDDLFAAWKEKMVVTIEELKQIDPRPLPRIEDSSLVTEHRGRSSAFEVLLAYDRMIENLLLAWQYHFEMLNIGYAAYLGFFQLCKGIFPGIGEELVAQMVSGTDILFFRPDDELRRLAAMAVDTGIDDAVLRDAPFRAVMDGLRAEPATRAWASEWDAASDPWFYFSNGNGFYHHHRSWIDDPSVPWAALRRYVEAARSGESLARPTGDVLRRRDELVDGYRGLLDSEDDRREFERQLSLARTVAGYIEDHNFYVEHWHHTVFWNKVRDFGRVLQASGFLESSEDVFLLNRWEVAQALYEMSAAWASGAPSRGPRFWTRLVSDRKPILRALQAWSPPPALGRPPEVVTEPLTVMLWGITDDRIRQWIGAESEGRLVGVPASPGSAEGPARVISTVAQLGEIRDGDILVAPITSPSWGPIFRLVRGVVTDIGGMMSHAAIVSREYGLPAVVGVPGSTRVIHTGDLVRVDGDAGEVFVLGSQAAGSTA